MRALAEIPAFAAIALGAHVALFAAWPGGAPEGAGDGGEAVLSIQGASGTVEAMVASWDAAPQTGAVPRRPDASPRAEPDLPSPAPETAPDVGDVLARLPVPQRAETPSEPAAPSPVALPVPALPAVPTPPGPPAEAASPPPPASRADTRPATATAALAPPGAASAPVIDTASARPVPRTRPKARPEQAAGGAGAQGTRGNRAESAAPSLSDSARRSLVASWGAEIRARVEARKVHPAGLRAAGRPVVRITVARSGALEAVSIVKSSRSAALDEAAVRAVRRAGRLPAAPGQLDLARVSFDLPISFTR